MEALDTTLYEEGTQVPLNPHTTSSQVSHKDTTVEQALGETVNFTPQELTPEQQAQTRRNINALEDEAGVVDEEHIATGAVTTPKIADTAVTSDKIADYAVIGKKIASGAITNDKIRAGAVSADKLNTDLLSMINSLGAGYQFIGVATPTTNPENPDAKVFYIANGKGTYTNFGGIEVTEDEVVVLYYDTEWHKVATGIASQDKLTELEEKVDNLAEDIVSINDTFTEILPIMVKTTQTLMDLQFVNGYYKDTGEIVDVSWAKRTEAVSLDGIEALVFEGTFTNFPGGFIIFYKNGENVYRQNESAIYAATKPFIINCENYDEVKFSFNATDIDLKKVYAQRKSEIDAIKEKTESLESLINKKFNYSFAPKVIGNFPFPIGEVFNIYRENVVTNEQEQEIIDYLANDMDEKKFMLYQNSEGNKEYSHIIYSKDFTDYLVNNFTIAFKEKNSTAKKVLLLGDSTIDTIVGGSIVQDGRIVHYLNNAYGGNLTLIGTRGEAPYKHCGIGGWSAIDWVSKSDGNPFYNPQTSAFDFAYGIINNSLETPEYVIIQLGINDVTATTSPTQFNTRMEAYIDAMQQIVNSIKAYSSSIKVCVNMIIPPSKDWNHYTAYAGAILTPNIAKWHNIIASHNALTRLTNVDYFLPINCVIDRDTMLADRVHPNAIGYETIAVFLANCLSVM